jgi:hypothetical protein
MLVFCWHKKGITVMVRKLNLKAFVKYKTIGSDTKGIMEFRFGGLDSRFWLWNEVFLSSAAERFNGMES